MPIGSKPLKQVKVRPATQRAIFDTFGLGSKTVALRRTMRQATVTILWPKDAAKVVTVSETLESHRVAAAATYVNQPSNRNAVWTDHAEPKQTDCLHLTTEAKLVQKKSGRQKSLWS